MGEPFKLKHGEFPGARKIGTTVIWCIVSVECAIHCYYYKIHLNPWVPYSPKQSKGLLWVGRCSCSLPWLILRVLLFGSPFSGGVALREGPGHSCCCLAFQYWSCNYMRVCRAGAIPDTLHHEPLTSKDAASGKFIAANPNLICWIPTWRSHASFTFPIEDLGFKQKTKTISVQDRAQPLGCILNL